MRHQRASLHCRVNNCMPSPDALTRKAVQTDTSSTMENSTQPRPLNMKWVLSHLVYRGWDAAPCVQGVRCEGWRNNSLSFGVRKASS